MSKRKKTLIIIIVIILVLAAVLGGTILVIRNNQKKAYAIQIEDINLESVPDGTYHGQRNVFPVSAEVAVTVTDHRIAAIDLVKHNHGQGGPAEVIPQMVVEAGSMQVDTIAGATFSSKVILLAIQDALQNATGQ